MTKRNSVSASKKNHKLYRHRTLFYIWIIKRLHPFISPTQSESNIQSAMVAKKSEKWKVKYSIGEKVWFHAQLASSFPVVHLNISIFTNRNWRFVVLHRRTRVLLFVETSMWFHHSTFHVEVNSTDQMLSSILTCHTFHWSISPPIRIQFFQHNFVYSGVQSAWVRFQEDSRDSDS